MTSKRNLFTYPELFFHIIDLAARNEQIPPIAQPNKHTAESNQKLFHKFRVALSNNKHPQTLAAFDLICRVTNAVAPPRPGQYYLEFASRGLTILADELRPSRGGAPSPLRDDGLDIPGLEKKPEPVDATMFAKLQGIQPDEPPKHGPSPDEEIYRKGFGGLRLIGDEKRKQPCAPGAHKWDEHGFMCLKCGGFKDELGE